MNYATPSLAIFFIALSGCGPTAKVETAPESSGPPVIHPEQWPQQRSPLTTSLAVEARVAELLEQMTLEEKVGQVIQADIASVTPEEVRQYHLGSILNGGNSAPGNDNRTAAENWLALADAMWKASVDTSDGYLGIPLMWGVDAVHGHNNIVGATLFPHNIGLGAANDPALMARIGEITAKEIRVTGNDWTFAPTVAVAQDDRWGRTFESYSENPDIVARYAGALVTGLQGEVNTDDFLSESHVIATVKHFVGDGSTKGGVDQGDSEVTEAELRDVHAAGYPPAIQAGVQVAMASYNSWYGTKMHGFKAMLTDVLVGRMGFDGFVVGDWNGHGQVKGCEPTSCPQAFNAGLDMFMAPDSWKALYNNTLKQVQDGTIPRSRLDEAVSRILRVKARAGILDSTLPSSRPYAGDFSLLGSEAHRTVAREAVRKSLVLLKNNHSTLPISADAHILVTGDAADDIGQAAGGWTLSWQGTGNENTDFPNGQSILAGLREQVDAAGGTLRYARSVDLSANNTLALFGDSNETLKSKPDVAIVVFGEQPYAEFQGDRPHLDFQSTTALEQLKRLQAAGIPTVSVFLSGRPLWVNPEINASDAFVAAWLPGTEGSGIADVLLSDKQGNPKYDFTGRLSFSWPATPEDARQNSDQATAQTLFPFGYGLSYTSSASVPVLDESAAVAQASDPTTGFLLAGDPVTPWQLKLTDDAGTEVVYPPQAASPSGVLRAIAADDMAQEDTVILTWDGEGSVSIEGEPVDLSRQSNGDMALAMEYKVLQPAEAGVYFTLTSENGKVADNDVTSSFTRRSDWQTRYIKLNCFADHVDMTAVSSPMRITSEYSLSIQVRQIRLVANQGQASCVF